jgi:hypothetical protein
LYLRADPAHQYEYLRLGDRGAKSTTILDKVFYLFIESKFTGSL